MRSARKSNNIRLMTEHSREKSPECFFIGILCSNAVFVFMGEVKISTCSSLRDRRPLFCARKAKTNRDIPYWGMQSGEYVNG